MNEVMQTFSFNPQLDLIEESKWLLAVISLEATISVFNVINENNSFSISTPFHWSPEDGEEFSNKLNKLLELRSESDIELHVNQIE